MGECAPNRMRPWVRSLGGGEDTDGAHTQDGKGTEERMSGKGQRERTVSHR